MKRTMSDLIITENLNVLELVPLVTPAELKRECPASLDILKTVIDARAVIRRILSGEDQRLMVIVGPCSIHDPVAAIDYARRLKALSDEVAETLFVIMRVYFEKPRTTVGWKGLIYDPRMDGSADMACGLRTARQLLLNINALGLPAGTEMLDPIVPQYIADLVAWTAIGARTSESQTHRQMASGLSMPVGFKNRTDGDVQVAVDAIQAARNPQSFLGIDGDGRTVIVRTAGNPGGHMILRGARNKTNFDSQSVSLAADRMQASGLRPSILVDCSHGNANKRFDKQELAWNAVLEQRRQGSQTLIGMLLESHLSEGNQKIFANSSALHYGISVTDECVGWEATERMLRHAAGVMRSEMG
ncbi:MAG: 3-deoxy-7-phosphoheptulonate synthase [bacterium]|jgi:3-deoxy-7-phosphoheptulonate synthase